MIAAACSNGKVHLWTWNGNKYLGHWQDLKSKSQQVDSDNETNANTNEGSGGWKVSSNTLLPPIFTYNSFSVMNSSDRLSKLNRSPTIDSSDKNKFVYAIHGHGKPGENWVSFLEEIQRRNRSKESFEWITGQDIGPVTDLDESMDGRKSAIDPRVMKRGGVVRPLTARIESLPESIGPFFSNITRDEELANVSTSCDYDLWKESLTATDNLKNDDSDRVAFSHTFASASNGRPWSGWRSKDVASNNDTLDSSDCQTKEMVMMQRLVSYHTAMNLDETETSSASKGSYFIRNRTKHVKAIPLRDDSHNHDAVNRDKYRKASILPQMDKSYHESSTIDHDTVIQPITDSMGVTSPHATETSMTSITGMSDFCRRNGPPCVNRSVLNVRFHDPNDINTRGRSVNKGHDTYGRQVNKAMNSRPTSSNRFLPSDGTISNKRGNVQGMNSRPRSAIELRRDCDCNRKSQACTSRQTYHVNKHVMEIDRIINAIPSIIMD